MRRNELNEWGSGRAFQAEVTAHIKGEKGEKVKGLSQWTNKQHNA